MIGWRGAWMFGDELLFQGVPGLLVMTPEIERLYRAVYAPDLATERSTPNWTSCDGPLTNQSR